MANPAQQAEINKTVENMKDHAEYVHVSQADVPSPDEIEYSFVEKEGEAKNGVAEKPEKGASEQKKYEKKK